MSEDLIVCPNCGADLVAADTILCCEYCGYRNNRGNAIEIEPNMDLEFYSLIKHYECSILSSKYIKVINWDINAIDIEMIKDYSPRVIYSVYPNLRFNIKYTYDMMQEWLYLVVDADSYISNPIIAINTDRQQIVLDDYHCDHTNRLLYRMSSSDFVRICHSENVDIIPDLLITSDDSLNFDEFIHYIRRFYNQCLLHTEFIYSINKHLICD